MIANERYDLVYNPAKNQINWKVKGFWPSASAVPDMGMDWATALAQAKKPGFNILADLTEMQLAPQDVQDLRPGSAADRPGRVKIAAVAKSTLVRMTVKNIGAVSGMNQMIGEFSDLAKAQAWLDEKA